VNGHEREQAGPPAAANQHFLVIKLLEVGVDRC
jgi:hypothetical protein